MKNSEPTQPTIPKLEHIQQRKAHFDVWEITNKWVPSQINNEIMKCGQTSECSKVGRKD